MKTFWIESLSIGMVCFITSYSSIKERHSESHDNSIESIVEYISLDQVLFLQQIDCLIIDIREKRFYNAGHIIGAIHYSVDDEHSASSIANMRVNNLIIYGNATDTYQAQQVALKIFKIHNIRIKVFDAGWEQWKACKLPMESTNE